MPPNAHPVFFIYPFPRWSPAIRIKSRRSKSGRAVIERRIDLIPKGLKPLEALKRIGKADIRLRMKSRFEQLINRPCLNCLKLQGQDPQSGRDCGHVCSPFNSASRQPRNNLTLEEHDQKNSGTVLDTTAATANITFPPPVLSPKSC